MSLLLSISLSFAAVVWTIPEVTCSGCEIKLQSVFSEIEGARFVSLDVENRQICIEGDFKTEAAVAGLQESGYSVGETKTVARCTKPSSDSLWHQVDGDVQIISNGERINLRKSVVDGKYTLYDFGGPWCPPCLVSTRQLATVVSQRSDLAIRVVELMNPSTAFDTPVAYQHLSDATGVPWFILYNPKGKEIYRGSEVDAVLKLLP